MKDFTNPLDHVKIASPCAANWNEMIGDERRRFCSDCQLNVYNLSAMTKSEAESLLINSEGRLCVRFYRRADGTILTQNCPIGWAKVKQRVSKTAAAAFSLVAGFFGGFTAFGLLTNLNQDLAEQIMVENETEKIADKITTRILLETNELSDEIVGEIPMSVGKMDPIAFSHIKKNYQKKKR